MATLETPLPPQVEQYLDYFNHPDCENPTIKAYYLGKDDIIKMKISTKSGIEINIPINDASRFCLCMHPIDFKDKIINTILSVFSHYNAS